jgi:hypothetical protein
MEGGQAEFTLLAKPFRGPAVLLRGDFEVAEHGADVDGLAVVAAVIFAEALHDLRFTIHELRVNAKAASIVYRQS